MNGTPMRLVIHVLGAFGFTALVGALVLLALGIGVPDGIWMIASGASGSIAGLLANPRSGMDTRSTDTIKTDTIETESLKVGSGA